MAFGNFQNLLADYPADTLFETIEGFHDTKARFEFFKRAVETDIKSRAAGVKKEIQFVLDHEDVACCFSNLQLGRGCSFFRSHICEQFQKCGILVHSFVSELGHSSTVVGGGIKALPLAILPGEETIGHRKKPPGPRPILPKWGITVHNAVPS